MNSRKELIELNKLYRKQLINLATIKLLRVLEFTGLNMLYLIVKI
jgi:hypothetical protein